MSTRTTVLWVPDWPVVAAALAQETPRHLPVAVLAGQRVTAVNALARLEGVRRGMRRRQAQGCCPELVALAADDARDVRLFEPVVLAAETVVAGLEVARPGLLLLPSDGASRYHGSEETLADRLAEAVAERTGHECAVGTADGLLAAVLAARTGRRVPPGGSPAFLADRPVSELAFVATSEEAVREVDALVDLLHRLGLRTLGRLAALPAADVHARFGRLGSWAHLLANGQDERPPVRRRPEPDVAVSSDLDPPVDRVDTATFAGRRLAEELHHMLVGRSATCGRLEIAARTDEGADLVRTWRTDLGGWGGLTPARITDRVRWQLESWLTATAVATARDRVRDAARDRSRDVSRAARVARGREEDQPAPGELPDWPGEHEPARPVTLVRLAITALDVAPAGAEQPRLWGGPSGGDLRAQRVLERVQGIVGGSGLLTASLQGGRDVREQVHLRPWGEQAAAPRSTDRPWPGRLPDPAPATVLPDPEPVEVQDAAGRPVLLDERARLSGSPAWVCGPGRRDRVAGWAGPWLLSGRWWGSPADGPRVGRPRAHLQVTFDDGPAVLLVTTATGWACEARYD
ncbi:DNA polymerase Y family protein [Cellulomonas composti]|uniref:UmuC domain-containing protein n=1 Tax=Cellulomonas composti TaxID=266130 RepID=A0A511J5Z7_9CELL|nr:DNA polymerase Y family protein [Cellulomonas composti]GEL93404.1 hypothetical protein CCO02nite_00620 [Cellulomonas composti]